MRPEEIEQLLSAALESVGARVTQGFSSEDQEHTADPGYLDADIRVELPDGRKVWVRIECPTDAAFL